MLRSPRQGEWGHPHPGTYIQTINIDSRAGKTRKMQPSKYITKSGAFHIVDVTADPSPQEARSDSYACPTCINLPCCLFPFHAQHLSQR